MQRILQWIGDDFAYHVENVEEANGGRYEVYPYLTLFVIRHPSQYGYMIHAIAGSRLPEPKWEPMDDAQ